MDNKKFLKDQIAKIFCKSVGKYIKRDFNTINKIIDNGEIFKILYDKYFVYTHLDYALREMDVIVEIDDISKYPKFSIGKLIKEGIILPNEEDETQYIFSYNAYHQYGVNNSTLSLFDRVSKDDVPYEEDDVIIRHFYQTKQGVKEYFPDKGEVPPEIKKDIKKPKYIYKINFGEYGVYIGQTQNIKSRMNGHKNDAKKNEHCYVLNELYRNNNDFFLEALNKVEIIKTFETYEYHSEVTKAEYNAQIDALRNGEKLLGRQCWDDDFRNYLAYNVDEYEYHELLAKSYLINNDPNKHGGYSTYNERTKSEQPRMRYEDVVRYFESLRKERGSSSDGSFNMQ